MVVMTNSDRVIEQLTLYGFFIDYSHPKSNPHEVHIRLVVALVHCHPLQGKMISLHVSFSAEGQLILIPINGISTDTGWFSGSAMVPAIGVGARTVPTGGAGAAAASVALFPPPSPSEH